MNFGLCEKLMCFGLKSVGTLSKAEVTQHFADA